MNLQENIQRIRQMMGVINENEKSHLIKKMIDTIKHHDGDEYSEQFLDTDILTREDKIDLIKYIIKHKYDGSLHYGDREWPESDYDVIEKTKYRHVLVFGYDEDGLRLATFYLDENGKFQEEKEFGQTIKYTDLPDDMIDKVFDLVINRL